MNCSFKSLNPRLLVIALDVNGGKFPNQKLVIGEKFVNSYIQLFVVSNTNLKFQYRLKENNSPRYIR